jgi:cardiolipin synthase (CMP-forming)
LRWIPNLLTSLRLIAAPVLAWLIVTGDYRTAVALVAFAGVTDWFDGAAARRFGAKTGTGVVLDPLADKTLLVVLFLSLGWARLIPPSLLCLVIGRDLVIVIGSLLLRIYRGARRFVPSLMGKVSTFFQIVFVLLTLLQAAWPYAVLHWLQTIALALAAIFTLISGAGYVRLGIRMATRELPVY